MIDRISPASAAQTSATQPVATPAATVVARALGTALTAGEMIGTPLRQIAGQVAAALISGLGQGSDPVAHGRLEQATLAFGREVKAFAIGHPETSKAQLSERINGAVDLASADAEALPATFSPVDRAVALFERAANQLSEPSPRSRS